LGLQYQISEILESIYVWEDQVLKMKEPSYDKVILNFRNNSVVLEPLPDTDEISLTVKRRKDINFDGGLRIDNNCIGKKLCTIWECKNSQEYTDMIIFSFEYLRPSIGFLCEGSVLKLFRCTMSRWGHEHGEDE